MTTGEKITARDRFAERLRSLRERSGLSLKELESRIHTSDSSLSRYLAGKSLPPWPVVAALGELAECDPEELRPLWEAARSAPAANPPETEAPEEPEPSTPAAAPRRRWRRDLIVLAIGLVVGLGAVPAGHLTAGWIKDLTRPAPPPPNPLVHDNPASGPAGRNDYVTDPYVRTKTQPGEFRMTLKDSPSGWLCVKLIDAGTGQATAQPECLSNGETKTIVPFVPAVTRFQVAAMSGASGQYHGSMYY
jgi:transcriptional regulator with XRE-family HTH domain